MGREASSIFSRVMPMMDSSTMTRSSWFHLHTGTKTHAHHRPNADVSPELDMWFTSWRATWGKTTGHNLKLQWVKVGLIDHFYVCKSCMYGP